MIEEKPIVYPILCPRDVLQRKEPVVRKAAPAVFPHPFLNLTLDEMDQFEKFKLLIRESQEFAKYVTSDQEDGSLSCHPLLSDLSLRRFLVARDFNLKKSFGLLLEALQWRETYKPCRISASHVEDSASSGKQYRNGFDKEGCPVVYMWPGREQGESDEAKMKLSVYTLEKCIESMEEDFGVEQLNWIIDFQNYTGKHSVSFQTARLFVKIFSDYYPERLKRAFICDPPFHFHLLFKIIRPFIPSKTVEKIIFVKGNPEKRREVFERYFHLDQLEAQNGGSLEYEFHHEIHWKLEKQTDSTSRREIHADEETAA